MRALRFHKARELHDQGWEKESAEARKGSFAWALRNELKDTGVSVTCLMPGPTDTEFFDRAGMEDTKVGQGKKDDPADVAKTGFDAMMKGEGDVVLDVSQPRRSASGRLINSRRIGLFCSVDPLKFS